MQAVKLNFVPFFVVVNGHILFCHGGFWGVLEPEKVLTYTRHGWFQHVYAEDDWGVIKHMPRYNGGNKTPILIPQRTRLHISRGHTQVKSLSVSEKEVYDSYQKYFTDAQLATMQTHQAQSGRHIRHRSLITHQDRFT